MNVLLVGAGPMATAYARVLNALGARSTVVGRGAASAEKFKAACGIDPVLGGLDAFLPKTPAPSADAAIVALPVTDLAWATRKLADAGYRRILVEKPAGLTIEEIDEVARAAARNRTQIFVAYNRRFYASVLAARDMIAEDGGVTSFHMEFTEIESRILKSGFPESVLAGWFLANSSHVVDLAFHLCGQPLEMSGLSDGALNWHPPGAVFVGHGRTETGPAFTWHADWSSAGRWGLDIRTSRRRILLQPLEQLVVQDKGSFALNAHAIADQFDKDYKPGLYRLVEAFLAANAGDAALSTIAAHAQHARQWHAAICPGVAAASAIRNVKAGAAR